MKSNGGFEMAGGSKRGKHDVANEHVTLYTLSLKSSPPRWFYQRSYSVECLGMYTLSH